MFILLTAQEEGMKSLIYSEGWRGWKKGKKCALPPPLPPRYFERDFFYKRKVTNIFALAYVVISMYLKNLVTP